MRDASAPTPVFNSWLQEALGANKSSAALRGHQLLSRIAEDCKSLALDSWSTLKLEFCGGTLKAHLETHFKHQNLDSKLQVGLKVLACMLRSLECRYWVPYNQDFGSGMLEARQF